MPALRARPRYVVLPDVRVVAVNWTFVAGIALTLLADVLAVAVIVLAWTVLT